MKESIKIEFEALLKRQKELNTERTELEHEMIAWKKDPTLSEYEKKHLAKTEKELAESDKKMLLAEVKLAQIKKITFNV